MQHWEQVKSHKLGSKPIGRLISLKKAMREVTDAMSMEKKQAKKDKGDNDNNLLGSTLG